MENDARRAAVSVEGHHPGALAGVGRGYPGTDQRVEQRGLAGLDPADDRHPQWLPPPPPPDDRPPQCLAQPPPPVPQPRRCHRLVPVGLQGPVEEPADLRHHARLLAAVPARDRHGAVAAVIGAAVPLTPASPAAFWMSAASCSIRVSWRRRARILASRSALASRVERCADRRASASDSDISSTASVTRSRKVRCTIRSRSFSCLPTWKTTSSRCRRTRALASFRLRWRRCSLSSRYAFRPS